jgi:hypothetical protein
VNNDENDDDDDDDEDHNDLSISSDLLSESSHTKTSKSARASSQKY